MVIAIAALVCFVILVVAGAEHLRHLGSFRTAIRAQDVWPPTVTMPLAVTVAALEVGIGCAGIASVLLWEAGPLQTLLLATAICQFAGYAIYGLYLLRKHPGVPCACSHGDDPIDAFVVVRATVLAGLGALAFTHTPIGHGLSPLEVTVAILASLVYALTLWTIPAALSDPFPAIVSSQSREAR